MYTNVRINEFNINTGRKRFWGNTGRGFYIEGDFEEGKPTMHAFSSRVIKVPELYVFRASTDKEKEYLFIAGSNIL